MQRWAGRAVGYAILLALTVTSLFPLAWMIITSLRPRYEVFGKPLVLETLSLDAYQFVITDFHIGTFFGNSVIISFVTVLTVVCLATLTGYAFAPLDFWGKEVIFIVLLGTLMVPPTVLLLPLFLQLRDSGCSTPSRA